MQFEDAMVKMAIAAVVFCAAYTGGTYLGDQLRFWYLARQERQPLPRRKRETISKKLALLIGIGTGATSHLFVLGLMGGRFGWRLFLLMTTASGLLNIGISRFIGHRSLEFPPTQHLRSGYELGLYSPVTKEER